MFFLKSWLAGIVEGHSSESMSTTGKVFKPAGYLLMNSIRFRLLRSSVYSVHVLFSTSFFSLKNKNLV